MVNVMVYAKLIRKIIMSRPNGSIDVKKRKIKEFLRQNYLSYTDEAGC